jgi:hypothetical protein
MNTIPSVGPIEKISPDTRIFPLDDHYRSFLLGSFVNPSWPTYINTHPVVLCWLRAMWSFFLAFLKYATCRDLIIRALYPGVHMISLFSLSFFSVVNTIVYMLSLPPSIYILCLSRRQISR